MYGRYCGFDNNFLVTILTASSATSSFGRFVFGYIADRFSFKVNNSKSLNMTMCNWKFSQHILGSNDCTSNLLGFSVFQLSFYHSHKRHHCKTALRDLDYSILCLYSCQICLFSKSYQHNFWTKIYASNLWTDLCSNGENMCISTCYAMCLPTLFFELFCVLQKVVELCQTNRNKRCLVWVIMFGNKIHLELLTSL